MSPGLNSSCKIPKLIAFDSGIIIIIFIVIIIIIIITIITIIVIIIIIGIIVMIIITSLSHRLPKSEDG